MDEEKIRSLKDVEALLGPTRDESSTAAVGGIAPARFRLFCDITRKITAMDSLQDTLEQVLDAAILLTGAERGFLLLKDESARTGSLPGFSVAAARRFHGKAFEGQAFEVSLT